MFGCILFLFVVAQAGCLPLNSGFSLLIGLTELVARVCPECSLKIVGMFMDWSVL
jgi:hypothetical protein